MSELRFIERDGKKILQQRRRIMTHRSESLEQGMTGIVPVKPYEEKYVWEDVPLVGEEQ